MPKVFKKNCAYCGQYYEGYGAKYCCHECSTNAQRVDELPDLPDPSEFGLDVQEDGDDATVSATGPRITSLEQLLEAADVDLDAWEVERHVVNKWEVGVKVPGTPPSVRVEPLWQVKAWLRKKWEHSQLPQPVVLDITRPSVGRPTPVNYTTLHYSDLHIPHHDPRALNILYQIIDFVDPQMVVDHGDTLDCEAISKYPKDPFQRISLKEEIEMGAEHLGAIHSLSPDAEHVWIEGNHEDRLRRLVWKMAEDRQAGEILQLDAVREALHWKSLLGIGELGWEIYHYPEHKLLHDKLILTHGEKVRKDSGSSEKAEYTHYGKGGISGHTHRIGEYNKEVYDGQHGWIGLGCMCAIRTDYVSFPNWQQGFGLLTWSEDRQRYALERVRIFEGVAYFRGKRFVGDSTAFGDHALEAA